MSAELQRLRHVVAELRAAPIYHKAAKLEHFADALIALLVHQQSEINKLKSEKLCGKT